MVCRFSSLLCHRDRRAEVIWALHSSFSTWPFEDADAFRWQQRKHIFTLSFPKSPRNLINRFKIQVLEVSECEINQCEGEKNLRYFWRLSSTWRNKIYQWSYVTSAIMLLPSQIGKNKMLPLKIPASIQLESRFPCTILQVVYHLWKVSHKMVESSSLRRYPTTAGRWVILWSRGIDWWMAGIYIRYCSIQNIYSCRR